MATFNDFEQRKKENEMAREQRGSCVYIYIYYLQWKKTRRRKKHDKQETDYKKI